MILSLDFRAFCSCLKIGDIAGAKSLVTNENIHARDEDGDGVVACCCWFGPDEPELLHVLVEMGATLKEKNAMHYAASKGKPNLLRVLLLNGTNVDILNGIGQTPLNRAVENRNVECVHMLLDAGANVKLTKNMFSYDGKIWMWISRIQRAREKARIASIVIVGLSRCGCGVLGLCGRDVLRIVARCVWSTRANTDEWIK